MKVRLLTAAGIAIVGLPILIFSQYIIFPITAGVLSVLAVWEMLRVQGMHRKLVISIPAYLIAALMPFFAYEWFFPAQNQMQYLVVLALVLFLYLIYLISVAVFSGGVYKYENVSTVFTMVLYITVSFSALCLTRYMENGEFMFGMVFIAAWVCDIFAYFVGRLFGKHKLAPDLSPKKTIEGAVGGVLFTVAAFLLYGFIVESFFELKADYLILGALGFVLPIVAQIGDLWASLIKREHGVKDYSNILPGHGGIVDRFDSIFSTNTILMVVCMVLPPFVAAV